MHLWHCLIFVRILIAACADPGSFFQMGVQRCCCFFFFLLLFFFVFFLGGGLVNEWIQIPLKSGHHWPASETPLKWRFAGGPMMAQH